MWAKLVIECQTGLTDKCLRGSGRARALIQPSSPSIPPSTQADFPAPLRHRARPARRATFDTGPDQSTTTQ